MREALILIGQIFFISCLQIIIEVFVEPSSKPYQAKVLNIACFTGSLYLLIQFIFNNVLSEMATVMRFAF